MSWMDGLRAHVRQRVRRDDVEARMTDEMRFHLEMETEKHMRLGLSRAEAERRARMNFGGEDKFRESMRDGRRIPILEDLLRDVRYSLRSLRRAPGFFAIALLTLAIGIGATTTTFTVLNAVLLRPLPVTAPERLVSIREVEEDGRPRNSMSLPAYLDYRDAMQGTFAGVAAHHVSDMMVRTAAGTTVEIGMDVSSNYFDVLGVAPAAGRFFRDPAFDRPGAEPVAVISHRLWTTRYNRDPAAIGSAVYVNGQPLTIVAVTPPEFTGAMLGAQPAVWVPVGLLGVLNPGRDPMSRDSHWLQLFGRLEGGITVARATAATTAIMLQLNETRETTNAEPLLGARLQRFTAIPAAGQRAVAGFMILLFSAGLLVLVLAASNVASMLLARGSARLREMAIRTSIGANRARLVRQLLTESLVLSAFGAVGGVLLTMGAVRFLRTLRPPGLAAFSVELPINARVLAFTGALAVMTAIVFGLMPALRAARKDLVSPLRTGTPGAGKRSRFRGSLVAVQLAIAVLLLITAGLFVRTLQHTLNTEHGFDPTGVVAAEVNLQLSGHDEMKGREFQTELLRRLRARPEVEAAALASIVPLAGSWDQTRVNVLGFEPPDDEPGFVVGYNLVTPGYFETLRLPLLAGRDFDPLEAASAIEPIVINETFARRFWPNRSALGEVVRFGRGQARIIGIVPDGKYESFTEPAPLYAYRPLGASYQPSLYLHVRARRGDTGAAFAAVREEIGRLDPGVAPISVTEMATMLNSSLFPQRIAAGFIGSFGGLGLFLAAIGLFGLMSLTAAERTREIGVRMALGARRGQVVGMMMLYAARLLLVGVVIGLLLALPASGALRGLLFGLSPLDPVTFVGVPIMLTLVALLAVYLPARRAAGVDPSVTLRAD